MSGAIHKYHRCNLSVSTYVLAAPLPSSGQRSSNVPHVESPSHLKLTVHRKTTSQNSRVLIVRFIFFKAQSASYIPGGKKIKKKQADTQQGLVVSHSRRAKCKRERENNHAEYLRSIHHLLHWESIMGSTRARSIRVQRAQTADQSPLMKTNVVVVAAAGEALCRAPPHRVGSHRGVSSRPAVAYAEWQAGQPKCVIRGGQVG